MDTPLTTQYKRSLRPLLDSSFFLFGPRGTGKTVWMHLNFPEAVVLDLLDSRVFNRLNASPHLLSAYIPPNYTGPVVIDEIQKIPALLDEVHRLISNTGRIFVLTGSSARKLRTSGANLLAGRALTQKLFPLTSAELGLDFDLSFSLNYGTLPAVRQSVNPALYIASYVETYLKEEIMQEGLTRNLPAFSRFLEAASYSQGSVLNISNVAAEASVNRKVVEDYFSILRDTLVSYELPVFTKRAKRKLISKRKFYFFDVGVFNTLRPKGPLDSNTEYAGVALETLVLNELLALNEYRGLRYQISYWHTAAHLEVDFILYGTNGFFAIEVKSSSRLRSADLHGLRAFLEDYPNAQALLLYGGTERHFDGNIQIIPVSDFLRKPQSFLSSNVSD